MSGSSSVSWLRRLGVRGLAEVLSLRSDVLARPLLSLTELADRLAHPKSVQRALIKLDFTALGVLNALRVLGDDADRDELDRLVSGVPPGEVDAALAELERHAIAWPSGVGWQVAGPLRASDTAVLGLGAPAGALLGQMTGPQVIGLADRLRLGPAVDKSDAVLLLVDYFRDSDRIRTLASQAPTDAEELIEYLVDVTPRFPSASVDYRTAGAWGEPGQQWLMGQGFLLPATGYHVEMPREVGLALRGADYTVPVQPKPAEPTAIVISQSDVDGSASVAASAAVTAVTRLVELSGTHPLVWRKSGGVGVRELRRAAKSLGCEESAARLWVELARSAGLLVREHDELVPTTQFDAWRERQPGARIGLLHRAWLAMAHSPSGQSGPVFLHDGDDADAELRRDLLETLASRPRTAFIDLDEVVAEIGWRRPLAHRIVHGEEELLLLRAHPIVREAELLGVLARNSASTFARCLIKGEEPAEGLLPGSAETARFGADLTAVVVGIPSAGLTALLDEAADVESRDAAAVWRFSQQSVRRALDGGHTATSLLGRLVDVAVGELPQPLVYLVNDIARRHGELVVNTVGCCVCAEDAVLLAEVAAHSDVRELEPRLLAPTVLASAVGPARTLQVLRDAGYAPVISNASGAVVVERVEPRRAKAGQVVTREQWRREQPEPVVPPEELFAYAATLLDEPTES